MMYLNKCSIRNCGPFRTNLCTDSDRSRGELIRIVPSI